MYSNAIGEHEVSSWLSIFSSKCSIHHESMAPKCLRGKFYYKYNKTRLSWIVFNMKLLQILRCTIHILEWRSMYFNITSTSRRSSKRRASMWTLEPYSKCQVSIVLFSNFAWILVLYYQLAVECSRSFLNYLQDNTSFSSKLTEWAEYFQSCQCWRISHVQTVERLKRKRQRIWAYN